MSVPPPAAAPPPKAENLWINLLCNAAFPALVLIKLSDEARLGPVRALLLALSLPLAYGLYDLVTRRKWNIFSIVGVVGTLLTGGLGLMKLSGIWFAVKEAAIPLVLAGAVLFTQRTKQPLVKLIVCNESVLNMPRVNAALDEAGARPAFDRLLGQVAWIIAGSFVLSAILNFFLALYIMKSPPGTPEAAKELGRLTGLSFPVIVLPSMAIMLVAMFKLLNGLEKLTGLKGEELFHQKPKPAPKPAA